MIGNPLYNQFELMGVCLCIDSEMWIIVFGRNVFMNLGFG